MIDEGKEMPLNVKSAHKIAGNGERWLMFGCAFKGLLFSGGGGSFYLLFGVTGCSQFRCVLLFNAHPRCRTSENDSQNKPFRASIIV